MYGGGDDVMQDADDLILNPGNALGAIEPAAVFFEQFTRLLA